MLRPITGFRLDEEGDWTAILSCGHPRHVRHKPPFINRPWVVTEAGRKDKLGEKLDCVRCERFEIPADFVCYKQTPEFTRDSIPAGLLRDHATAAGIWGRIVVTEGRLRYHVQEPETETALTPEQPGTIIPEVRHYIEAPGPVRFYVEFLRSPQRR